MKDIGKTIIGGLCDYIANNKNRAIIFELIRLEVRPEKPENVLESEKLSGKTVVVTGTLENFSRNEIKQAIKDNGGKVSSSVSKKTDFVLAGNNPGSKLQKARQLGVGIINENQFLKMIGRA